jgi:hypothetical protein
MSPASQLMGAAVDTGQPVEYTAAAVWTVRGTGEVKKPHLQHESSRNRIKINRHAIK